jgi:uncharacterized membrane protein
MTVTAPQPTSTGLDQNVAGLLAYLFGPVSGIVFYILEKENTFVRFHAVQSILVAIASVVFWIGFTVLSSVLAFIPILGWIVSGLVSVVAGFAFFALWIVLMVKAFQGQEWEVPIVGKYARQYAQPATIG